MISANIDENGVLAETKIDIVRKNDIKHKHMYNKRMTIYELVISLLLKMLHVPYATNHSVPTH